MNNFVLAYRSLLKKGQNNIIKILSLGVGLAVGLILVSKVFFDNSYDDFYPDGERIYQIQSNLIQDNDPPMEWGQVSGAIAPGMKAEVPGVELSTRYSYMAVDGIFYTADKNSHKGIIIMGDSCLFEMFPRPIIIGNAKKVLSSPMYALVSQSIAERIGGDVVGKTIILDNWPKNELTIGGVFEDIPENSHLKFDVVVSMASIVDFYSWDGSQNWLGNDRYRGYVKLSKGVQTDDLTSAIRQMQVKNQNIEEVEDRVGKLFYSFIPLTKLHSDAPETKRMTILLSAIAFALLFTAVMNYVLLVLSSLVGRAKTIAVYKCYGAEEKDVSKLIFSESFLHLLISLFIAMLLIFCFRGLVEEILSTSVYALFSFRTCIFLLTICVFILLIVGYIPSYIFSRIPVATVFRNLRVTRNGWKVALLFVQIVAATFLVNLLVIVAKQYDIMINDNPGYKYENVLYSTIGGIDRNERQRIVEELRKVPEVNMVTTASQLLFKYQSGNNVSLVGDERELFNIADLYSCDENYFPMLEIPVIQGKGFDENSTTRDILVSQSFADKIALLAGWTDGVVGKNVLVSEHSYVEVAEGQYELQPLHIIGVYPNIRIGSISNMDTRPSAIFYSDKPSGNTFVKLNDMNQDNIQRVYDVIKGLLPDKEITVVPYKASMTQLYNGSRLFRNTITIGGIVTIIITLIGLIGYTTNEVNRRKYEIAVRKVNGATLADILILFVKNNLWIALPALICGSIIAVLAAIKWMENFAEKISLTPFIFIISGIVVLLIIISVVVMSCMRVATQNPVETLKND